MSAPIKALVAAAALMAVATPALAQDTGPWDLRERNAYVLDMQGKMWSTQKIGPQGWAMMTRSAKAVPRGTVFFTNGGKLYDGPRRHVRPLRRLRGDERSLIAASAPNPPEGPPMGGPPFWAHRTAITCAQIAIMLTNRASDVRAATSSIAARNITSSMRT